MAMDGIGSTDGTGELGAEYRLFILILTGGVSVPFRDLRNAGVDIRMLAGKTGGRWGGLGVSRPCRFLEEDLGVSSRLPVHRFVDSWPLDPFFAGGLSVCPSEPRLLRLLGGFVVRLLE